MKRLLCYGDSNTWGYNPETKLRFNESERWTSLCQKALGSEYTIVEEGHNGRTFCFNDASTPTRNGLDHLQMILESQRPLDLIIIMLGTNDAKMINNAGPKAITRGLRTTLRMILNPYTYEKTNIPKVLVVAPIHLGDNYQNAVDTYETFKETSNDTINKLASYFEAMAKEYNCYFMDASEYAKAGRYDGVHLDKDNHHLLSEAMVKKIKEILE